MSLEGATPGFRSNGVEDAGLRSNDVEPVESDPLAVGEGTDGYSVTGPSGGPRGHTFRVSCIRMRVSSVFSLLLSFPMYVALTNIPVGELLTGFAMRSDPNVVFG